MTFVLLYRVRTRNFVHSQCWYRNLTAWLWNTCLYMNRWWASGITTFIKLLSELQNLLQEQRSPKSQIRPRSQSCNEKTIIDVYDIDEWCWPSRKCSKWYQKEINSIDWVVTHVQIYLLCEPALAQEDNVHTRFDYFETYNTGLCSWKTRFSDFRLDNNN